MGGGEAPREPQQRGGDEIEGRVMIDPAPEPDDEDWGMAAARAKLAPKHDNTKKARQQRQQRIARAVDRSARDGRSLR